MTTNVEQKGAQWRHAGTKMLMVMECITAADLSATDLFKSAIFFYPFLTKAVLQVQWQNGKLS